MLIMRFCFSWPSGIFQSKPEIVGYAGNANIFRTELLDTDCQCSLIKRNRSASLVQAIINLPEIDKAGCKFDRVWIKCLFTKF